MYVTQEIANRIKKQLKNQHKTSKDMLSTLNMGINTISELAKGKQMSCISLAHIADYLNCSVDYLLGRTDTPIEESCNDIVLSQMERQVLIGYRKTDDLTKEMVHRVLHIEEKRDSEKMA